MGRGLTALAAALVIALAAVGAARAEPQDDARVTAEGFVNALLAGDAATTCSLMSTRLQGLIAQDDSCAETLTFGESAESQDYRAQSALYSAYFDALFLRFDEPSALYPAPAGRLARLLQRGAEGVRFVVGTGPSAARNRPVTTIVVDRKLTTKRRVVLYAESDSGAIWRLSSGLKVAPTFQRAATGVPAPPEAPAIVTVATEWVTMASPTDAVAALLLTSNGETQRVTARLRLEAAGWRVDDLMTSLFDLFGSSSSSSAT
jgi:hypothetical protein